MPHVRLPVAVCAAVAEVLRGSHKTLDALFDAAGAPGPPPDLSHESKWKTWLFRAGNDPKVDTLRLLGNLIEEFMDVPPRPPSSRDAIDFANDPDPVATWNQERDKLRQVLEEHGFQYFRGGRVLPKNSASGIADAVAPTAEPSKPSAVEGLLQTIIKGLPRAMHPLAHRRKGAQSLSFESEWDIQDLLHSQLRPWIADIRPEEYTPSYAGSSTRMDFLLPRYSIVVETKRIRDRQHAAGIGNELIIDIEHYRRHPACQHLWCVVYDPLLLVKNPAGLINDLTGTRVMPDGSVRVRDFVLGG